MKQLNLLRMITSRQWGAVQYRVMKIYRMYIRSELDYGRSVYGSATPTLVNSLQVVSNESL